MMIDIIKKTVLAGIGATVVSKEKIEGLLEGFVEKGKLSSSEAREMAEKIVADGKKEFEKAQEDLGKAFKELLEKANLATRSQLADVEARVKALEEARDSEAEGNAGHQ